MKKDNAKKLNSKTEEKRREFLKKVAYKAPVLLTMGQLLKPTKVHADSTGGPVGPPTWGGW